MDERSGRELDPSSCPCNYARLARLQAPKDLEWGYAPVGTSRARPTVPPHPTDRTASGEGGSRQDTSAGRASLLEVLANQKVHVCRSDGGGLALLGVPQQGGGRSSCVSYSCSNTRLLRSACVPPVFSPLISHFPVCGSCSFMHPSPHPSPSPRLLKFPPHLHSRRKSIAEGTGIPHTETFIWRKTMILTTRPSQDD